MSLFCHPSTGYEHFGGCGLGHFTWHAPERLNVHPPDPTAGLKSSAFWSSVSLSTPSPHLPAVPSSFVSLPSAWTRTHAPLIHVSPSHGFGQGFSQSRSCDGHAPPPRAGLKSLWLGSRIHSTLPLPHNSFVPSSAFPSRAHSPFLIQDVPEQSRFSILAPVVSSTTNTFSSGSSFSYGSSAEPFGLL